MLQTSTLSVECLHHSETTVTERLHRRGSCTFETMDANGLAAAITSVCESSDCMSTDDTEGSTASNWVREQDHQHMLSCSALHLRKPPQGDRNQEHLAKCITWWVSQQEHQHRPSSHRPGQGQPHRAIPSPGICHLGVYDAPQGAPITSP